MKQFLLLGILLGKSKKLTSLIQPLNPKSFQKRYYTLVNRSRMSDRKVVYGRKKLILFAQNLKLRVCILVIENQSFVFSVVLLIGSYNHNKVTRI